MTSRIRIAVAGAGLIAQVEHLPNLALLNDRFDLVGISDPSPRVRHALAARYRVPTVADAAELLALEPQAMLIAAPDPFHANLVAMALDAGLHVFCEKPLTYGTAVIDALIGARNRVRRVLQVGTMKRFDPAYRAARDLVAGRGARLRYVSVEVRDPDAWPFVAHKPFVPADDMPSALVAEMRARRRAQVASALGFEPDPLLLEGFCGPFASALVHDVNLVHGLLQSAGVEVGDVRSATVFASGKGGHATVDLAGGALWSMAHVETPDVADYAERIAFLFEDGMVELLFPSPYLDHFPTRLRVVGSRDHEREEREIRAGFGEAFKLELEGFADAVHGRAPPVNTAEEARRDQALLVAIARRAAGA